EAQHGGDVMNGSGGGAGKDGFIWFERKAGDAEHGGGGGAGKTAGAAVDAFRPGSDKNAGAAVDAFRGGVWKTTPGGGTKQDIENGSSGNGGGQPGHLNGILNGTGAGAALVNEQGLPVGSGAGAALLNEQ